MHCVESFHVVARVVLLLPERRGRPFAQGNTSRSPGNEIWIDMLVLEGGA